MPSLMNRPTDKDLYWRSFEELGESPEFVGLLHREFTGLGEELNTPTSRRNFLKLMGASAALAGLTGCRWPKETIVPFTKNPYNRTAGIPVHYATAVDRYGYGTGLLAKSYEGRPIKIEGNDKHSISRGKSDHLHQAAVLDLYDPDRSTQPLMRDPAAKGDQASAAGHGEGLPAGWAPKTWDAFDAFAKGHFEAVRSAGGDGFFVVCEATSSPTLAELRGRFRKALPKATWLEYEPVSFDAEREGTRSAYGRPLRARYDLTKAEIIVSLDSDFLMSHPASLQLARDFAARRSAEDGHMSRLYVVESTYSITGANADHRFAVRSGDIGALASQLAKVVAGAAADVGALPPRAKDAITKISDDLKAHKGKSVVMAGPRQPAEVHALACVLNHTLGNTGKTVSYLEVADADRPTHAKALQTLAEALDAGKVGTLLLLGTNLAYAAPGSLKLADKLGKAKVAIHLSDRLDETSRLCTWHLPKAHFLESWGDVRAVDGTVSITQPLIEPLYAGRTPLELIAQVTGEAATDSYSLVRRTLQAMLTGRPEAADFDLAWNQALHDGVVAGTATAAAKVDAPKAPADLAPAKADGFELVFAQDYSVFDGRYANNSWLQELPDPVSKLTWDNAALIAPSDADKLGISKKGDQLRIQLGDQALVMPAYIMPGHAVGSITLPLGYGRRHAGPIALEAGVNVYPLLPTGGEAIVAGAKVAATGTHYKLVGTQDHHAITSDVGKKEIQRRLPELYREAPLSEFLHHKDFAKHRVHLPILKQLWEDKPYDGYKWGMTIDLSACIGCSACVTACQAENNIPVVGKDEVARGREMHWIRIDRYFRGSDTQSPDAVCFQPVNCMHCENAPCEQVCPVAATVHDQEGLNVMVYNRCVGTRYCNNNCPYKVRRFNWFYNHNGPAHPRSKHANIFIKPGKLKQLELTDIEKMVHNPDVTVRSRGVMEKCTYCVQRIKAVTIPLRNANQGGPLAPIPDGAIVPACAQACPTDAIAFGNLNDPESRIAKLQKHDRSYGMLSELLTQPRTLYLAKLRNPNEPGGGHDGHGHPGEKKDAGHGAHG